MFLRASSLIHPGNLASEEGFEDAGHEGKEEDARAEPFWIVAADGYLSRQLQCGVCVSRAAGMTLGCDVRFNEAEKSRECFRNLRGRSGAFGNLDVDEGDTLAFIFVTCEQNVGTTVSHSPRSIDISQRPERWSRGIMPPTLHEVITARKAPLKFVVSHWEYIRP